MAKFTAFVLIVALRIAYHPSSGSTTIAPFASPSPIAASTISIKSAKLINFRGSISNNKVFLYWTVAENQTADQFEVEKSTDGKNFTLAALVFGTDKPETDSYQFYEKAGNQKTLYRIKMINKNHKAEYSSVVEINPTV